MHLSLLHKITLWSYFFYTVVDAVSPAPFQAGAPISLHPLQQVLVDNSLQLPPVPGESPKGTASPERLCPPTSPPLKPQPMTNTQVKKPPTYLFCAVLIQE